MNVDGGAIALGHPLGASGGRLITSLVHGLRRTGGRYGLATMCIGVGQGIATIVERIDDVGGRAASTGARPARRRRPAIETRELRKEFGRIVALAGLTMTVPRGEVFGFLGPNGAGKTTSVKLLLGLSRPTAGDGRVLGAPLGRSRDATPHRLPARAVPLPGLDDRPRGARPALRAGPPATSRLGSRGSRAALDLVGLTQRADDRTETFSKGMQQRLGLGVAFLGRPDLVVLDEPTSALDPVGRQDVRRIIASLRDRGVTVFLNSHLLTEVERVCDRVAIVDHGRVVAELTMTELLRERGVEHPGHRPGRSRASRWRPDTARPASTGSG